MRKVKPPKLVTVAVFTTITIIFWIFFTVYNVLTSAADIDIDEELLKPINTNLDTQTLDQLPNKRFFDQSFSENVFDVITQPDQSQTVVEQESEPEITLEDIEPEDDDEEEAVNETTPTPDAETP